MISVIQLLLLKLNPEIAHHIAVRLLSLYQFFKTKILRQIPQGVLLIKVPRHFEWKLSSRLGMAAGFDKQAQVFPALFHLGFGFVEVGTVTPLPQPGNPPPRIWRVAPQALVNHFGFNSIGLEVFKKNIRHYRRQARLPVLANIGKNKSTPAENALSDYESCLKALEGNVDGFVINISSPNTPGLRELQSTEFIRALCKVLPLSSPVLLKLAPDISISTLQEICELVLSEDCLSGLVLVNTSRELSEKRGFSQGGLSGPPLFSTSMDFIERARQILLGKKIIIGVGGVSSLEEAQQMRDSGADLIEIYTSFIYQGPKLIKTISSRLQ